MIQADRGHVYASLLRRVPKAGSRDERMKAVVNLLWDALHPMGASWIGFYFRGPGAEEMTLGYRRDKPACSPIGLHGACGRCLLSKRALVVTDVSRLGANYVACDPRDRSEVVVPLFDERGECHGVLDADSYEVGAFSPTDALELESILVAAGLSCGAPGAREADVV
jgi:putative methionine-R-sulfoxide reductase with GAF domain